MKRHFLWILAYLILNGLLGFTPISLAEEEKWTNKADMPTARSGHSASVVDGKIYIIGGAFDRGGGDAGLLATIEEYDPVTNKWTRKADIPTPRGWLSTSVVDGKIYAIGGMRGAESVSTVEEYNPKTDKWKKKADMPTARDGLGTSVVDEKIYAIGGLRTTEFLSTVEEYNPKTDTWTKKADMPTKRWALSCNVVHGKIYAIGGYFGGQSLSTVEEYDLKTDTWTRKADMPTKRELFSTSVVNGKIYAIGGRAIVVGRPVHLSIVEEYDPRADKWTRKTDMPTARGELSTSVVDRKIYAIGGRNSQLNLPQHGVLAVVEEFDLGLVGEAEGAEPKGKLVTLWGKIKSNHENLKKHE